MHRRANMALYVLFVLAMIAGLISGAWWLLALGTAFGTVGLAWNARRYPRVAIPIVAYIVTHGFVWLVWWFALRKG